MITADDGFSWLPPRISRAGWCARLSGYGTDAGAWYDALVAHHVEPLFPLAIFHHESNFGTNPASVNVREGNHNPGNLRNPPPDAPVIQTDRGPFLAFATWDAGFDALGAHLDSTIYRGLTIGQAIAQWAPASDGNDPRAYLAGVLTDMNAWGDTDPGGLHMPNPTYSFPVDQQLQNNARSSDRGGQAIQAIVCHVTAGESLAGALAWNRNPASPAASAHFYIDKIDSDGDGYADTVQDVDIDRAAWGCGVVDNPHLPDWAASLVSAGVNPNSFTINIEHVGNPNDADFPTAPQLRASRRLIADLCNALQVPVDREHILQHAQFDSVNRPDCPGPRFDMDAEVREVSALLNGEGNVPISGDGQNVPGNSNTGGAGSSGTGATGDGAGDGAGSSADSGGTDQPITISGSGAGRTAQFAIPGGATRITVGEPWLSHYESGYPAGDGPAGGEPCLRYGWPITPDFVISSPTVNGGAPTHVLYTERARFELVPGADGAEPQIVEGRLGSDQVRALPAESGVPASAWRG